MGDCIIGSMLHADDRWISQGVACVKARNKERRKERRRELWNKLFGKRCQHDWRFHKPFTSSTGGDSDYAQGYCVNCNADKRISVAVYRELVSQSVQR